MMLAASIAIQASYLVKRPFPRYMKIVKTAFFVAKIRFTVKRIYPRLICSSQKTKQVISVTIASPPCMRSIFGLLVMLP